MDIIDVVKEQLVAFNEHKNHAIVTITNSEGTTTRSYGKMIVFTDGSIKGTIGGGAVELMAIKDAVTAIEKNENTIKSYDTITQASEAGKTCGGRLTVFIEAFQCRPLLVVCGAGHVGKSVLTFAHDAGFDTLLFDDRDDAFFEPVFKLADKFVKVENYTEAIKNAFIPDNSYAVVATHAHNFDCEAIAGLTTKKLKYLGMLGSKKKVGMIVNKLREQGYTNEQLSMISSPIGINLGGETPEEIGFAVIAELLMAKNNVEDPRGTKFDINSL